MPPSGFASQQSQSVVMLLRSCAADLRVQNEYTHGPLAALEREITEISMALDAGYGDDMIKPLLLLIRAFYLSTRSALNGTTWATFDSTVEAELASVNQRVLDVDLKPHLTMT